MPTYVVEASFPGAGKLTADERGAVTRRVERVTSEFGPSIRWQHAYVTADRLYLVYAARDEQQVRRHLADIGIQPVSVEEVTAALDPQPLQP